jgi:hypothetical protein
MMLLGSGSVDATTFMPNKAKISFICGLPLKLSSDSSKPDKERKNIYSLNSI